jgi:zinc transporter ZupT
LFFHFLIKFIPEQDLFSFSNEVNNKIDQKLIKTSIVVFTGICLHNFPEGLFILLYFGMAVKKIKLISRFILVL